MSDRDYDAEEMHSMEINKKQAQVDALKAASGAPTAPTVEQRVAALEAQVASQAKEIVLLRARCMRAEMQSDGVINFLANSAPR